MSEAVGPRQDRKCDRWSICNRMHWAHGQKNREALFKQSRGSTAPVRASSVTTSRREARRGFTRVLNRCWPGQVTPSGRGGEGGIG